MTAALELVIGGEPRVSLLPPEVQAARRSRVLRRALGIAVVAVAVIVVGGMAAASWQAMQVQSALSAAQDRTTQLLNEQTRYVEVRQVQDAIDTTLAARWIGASTEINWDSYLARVRATLPDAVSVTSISIDQASPVEPYPQATVPLQGARVATLTLTLNSPTLPPVPQWLSALALLPGCVDGTPTSITRADTGAYLVTLVLHLGEEAFSGRVPRPVVPESGGAP